jgi:HSP20 family molecular chaperone IbpA
MGTAPAPGKSKGVTLPVIKETEDNAQEFENALHARIAMRAHQIFEEDGTGHGQDLAHWLKAEGQLISENSDIWVSGSWVTANIPLPKVSPETISVLVRRDRALVCVEARESADDSTGAESRRRVLYFSAKWPNEVDPSTSNAYLKNGVMTLSAKHATSGK